MRVVEPNKTDQTKSKSSKKNVVRFALILLLLVSVSAVASNILIDTTATDDPQPILVPNKPTSTSDAESMNESDNAEELRVFTDNEFKVFYDNLLQPNLVRVENPPQITGNEIADARIIDIAEKRGYRLRASPSVELVSVDGYLLQERVSEPWENLQKLATENGVNIRIVSGYRSVDEQRDIFLSRLSARSVSIDNVVAGTADDVVNEVLIESSIPGYSKHHTGYTFDLLCSGYAFENFKESNCNDWLSADNYKVAKENGFIPSYPPLADAQGPDPEAWEYVYVGTELLYD